MSDHEYRDAFFAALELDREDAFALTALADWYEEHQDPQASTCLHWAARTGRRPGFNLYQFTYGRFYWVRQDPSPIIEDPRAELPPILWDALTDYDEGKPVISFKSYRSAQSAYLALLAAWKRLPDPLSQETS